MKHIIRELILIGGLVLSTSVFSGVARAEDAEITIEEFLQKLSTIPDVVTRKDPFVEASPPFDVPSSDQVAASSDDSAIPGAPVLERYPLTSYEVVAVLLGDQYPRALVRLPAGENNKVVIVKEQDKLGNRRGVVRKIMKEGLVIQQALRSKFGFVDKAEVLLKVGGSAGEQTRALMLNPGVSPQGSASHPNQPKGQSVPGNK